MFLFTVFLVASSNQFRHLQSHKHLIHKVFHLIIITGIYLNYAVIHIMTSCPIPSISIHGDCRGPKQNGGQMVTTDENSTVNCIEGLYNPL